VKAFGVANRQPALFEAAIIVAMLLV